MKNTQNILLTLVFAMVATFAFAQIKVVAPNGDTGIGTSTPTEKLDVDGNLVVRDDKIFLGQDAGTAFAKILVGGNRTGTGSAGFDFYTQAGTSGANYHLRLQATSDGFSRFNHDSTNDFIFRHFDSGGAIKFFIGASSAFQVTSAGGMLQSPITTTGYQVATDPILMDNISQFNLGLDEIMELQPVSYNQTNGSKTQFVGVTTTDMKEIAPKAVSEYTVTTETEDRAADQFTAKEDTYETMNSAYIQFMLVNAVKEQQEMIDAKDAQIAALNDRLDQIEDLVIDLSEKAVQNVELEGFKGGLKQNQPNPFYESTSISYEMPKGAQSAVLQISDLQGRTLKSVTLDNSQDGEVVVKARELAPGTYTYTLIVDGKVFDTKKMVMAQ